jgi:hypothetical protein
MHRIVTAPAILGAGLFLVLGALLAPGPPAAGATVPAVTQISTPVALAAYDPCTGEFVELTGKVNFEALSTVLEDGQITLRFKVQATDVAGFGDSTGAPYRLVGEAHDVSTDQSGDRAVTAADFAVIATAQPGATVGRAHATADATIGFHVTLSQEGLVERLGIDSMFMDQDCT